MHIYIGKTEKMSKGKLAKFADMETYENVFQYPFSVVSDVPFDMRGHWNEQYFKNNNPIVLELGCGKGEYTVGLAKRYPHMNFIGVDIKGARMWTGATLALQEGLKNVAFLRTNIEIIDRFFAPNEVQEIWLTFSDPQMKNPRKRLSSTFYGTLPPILERQWNHPSKNRFQFSFHLHQLYGGSQPITSRTQDKRSL